MGEGAIKWSTVWQNIAQMDKISEKWISKCIIIAFGIFIQWKIIFYKMEVKGNCGF